MKNKENYYDVCISVGDACHPAFHMVTNDLRDKAHPLDWQKDYSLDTVIHLFETKFADFFVDIEEGNLAGDGEHRWIKDIKNDIVSIHHFSTEVDIKVTQKEFVKLMQKRFVSLEDELKKAKRVLLISKRTDGIEKLKKFIRDFWGLYPHLEIKLINIQNDEQMALDECKTVQHILDDALTIQEYYFNDAYDSKTHEKADWPGNEVMWGVVLKNCFHKRKMEVMHNFESEHKNIVIYGAGARCLRLLHKFDKYGIQIKGVAVTDILSNPKAIGTCPVNEIEAFDKEDAIIISIADDNEVETVKKTIADKGYHKIFKLDKYYNIEKIF